MHVEVVVNCGAGGVDAEAATTQQREIEEAFTTAGVEAAVQTVGGSDLERAVRGAAARRPDVVVVAGGDGSLGTAAGVLASADVPLGVIPLGTFNHFAKDLGVPLELTEAAAAIVSGEPSRIDLAEVNGRCFVNNSSIGLYPVMVDFRDDIRTDRGWGKVRTVPVASWRVLRRFPTRMLTITAGSFRLRLRSPFVFVGNNRYELGPVGAGARTEIDGGQLSCFVARTESRWGFVRMAVGAALRGASSAPTLEELHAPDVSIEAGGHRLLVAVDGEVTTIRSPLRYRIRPAALTVLRPAGVTPPTGPPEAPAAEAGVENVEREPTAQD